jgi:hypothetical protein
VKSLMVRTSLKILFGRSNKEDQMGGACGMYVGEKRWLAE